MPISVKLNKRRKKDIKNYVFFSDENFKFEIKDDFSLSVSSNNISELVKNNIKDTNKDFLNFNINPNQKIIIIKSGKNPSSLEIEKSGAKFYEYIYSNSLLDLSFFESNTREFIKKQKNFIDSFIHGIKLKSYQFNKYKSKKKKKINP